MPLVTQPPPFTHPEPVTETLHGVAVTDPYRWLENRNAPRTREWISEQTRYARSYLDAIPGRQRIHDRIRELLDVETCDSLQKAGNRYFFRKRLPGEEQPSIYMREGRDGDDQLLINPRKLGRGIHVAVGPRLASADGRLLLFEIKEGGERSGRFALLDVEARTVLPDSLPRGFLRGFAFAPDLKSFYYVHEGLDSTTSSYRAAYHHVLGTLPSDDREIFFAGENPKYRLILFSDRVRLGVLLCKFLDKTYTDFHVRPFAFGHSFEPVLMNVSYRFEPLLANDRILALTDLDAPNLRIVEALKVEGGQARLVEIVPETDAAIDRWAVVQDSIFVSYNRRTRIEVRHFSPSGKQWSRVPVKDGSTMRISPSRIESDELIVEEESFTEPIAISCYSPSMDERIAWAQRRVPFDSASFGHTQVWYSSSDGTRIPMFLMGRRDVLDSGPHPTILTSYGGSGVSMTPQFSVFVAFLVERGCLFALPNIRGGSEFGAEWHNAAKRRNRQKAFDDFLSAAKWLIESGKTARDKLAIFGGSNSGLLVGAALTQRPELFRAAVCMVPLLDMLRYHLFDKAFVWSDEYGTAEDPEDFQALGNYSPYHRVRAGAAYPATMLVSGDCDTSCNPMHARKMTARLQAATSSALPIILDYSTFRGHAPVLPLSERIEALTDRMAFLTEQLQLKI
ncbi:MAG: prolyl oligopeptidase family serine peptidase [Candidatus Acidiferrales bacterium]